MDSMGQHACDVIEKEAAIAKIDEKQDKKCGPPKSVKQANSDFHVHRHHIEEIKKSMHADKKDEKGVSTAKN